MTEILFLILAKGMIFALAGVCVRVQFALWRGFDLIVAAAVLVGAEIFVITVKQAGAVGPFVAPLAAILAAVAVVTVWNVVLARSLFGTSDNAGASLIVLSLGISTAVTGFVGLMRGPGLRLPPYSAEMQPVIYALVLAVLALIVAALWSQGRSGFALYLLSQNRQFAQELGVRIRLLALPASLMVGLAAGTVGSSLAATTGSTPEVGLQAFLYGAAAALIFETGSIKGPVLAGLLLGAASVVLQLFLAPGLAEAALFAAVVGMVIMRGSARTLQGVR